MKVLRVLGLGCRSFGCIGLEGFRSSGFWEFRASEPSTSREHNKTKACNGVKAIRGQDFVHNLSSSVISMIKEKKEPTIWWTGEILRHTVSLAHSQPRSFLPLLQTALPAKDVDFQVTPDKFSSDMRDYVHIWQVFKLYEYADDGQAISQMLRMNGGGFNNDFSDYGRPRGAEGRHWDSKKNTRAPTPRPPLRRLM